MSNPVSPGAISPNRLQPDTPLKDNIAYINDNFDKTVQAINDLGASLFNEASTSVSIASGYTHHIFVPVIDTINRYTPGNTPIIPLVKIYIDVDADDTYIFPIGSSLNSSQADSTVSVWSLNGYTSGAIGGYNLDIHNFSADTHTYYIYVNNFVFDSPNTGIFR